MELGLVAVFYCSLLISFLLLSTFFFCLYKYVTKDFSYWQKRNISYIKPTPFFGNLKDVVTFKKTIGHALADIYFQGNEPVIGIWCFTLPYLIIRSTELISRILCTDFNHFHNRAVIVDKNVDPVAGCSMFVLKYSEWKSIRHKMTPVFSSAKLKAMIPLVQENVKYMMNYIDNVPNEIIEVKEFFTKYTIDTITSCVFGVQANSFVDEKSSFRNVGREAFEGNLKNAMRSITYFLWPDLAAFLKIKFLNESVVSFFQSSFWDNVKARKASNMKRNDLVDILIKVQNETTDGEITDDNTLLSQVVTFFLAGFETTSAVLAFALYELSLNEKIQDTLREELNLTLLNNNFFTYETVREMRYLDKVVSETLRKYPPLPFIDRRCVEDYKIPGSDITVAAGTPILIPMLGIHHDPNIYPEPEKFDPERFSEGNFKKISGCDHIAFGVGPRSCIGERFGIWMIKFGLAEIISRYEIKKTEQTPVPLIFDKKSLTLTALDGLPLRFIKIEKKVEQISHY